MQAKKKKKKPAAPAASANAQHAKPTEAPKPQQPSKPKSTKKGKGKDKKKDNQDDLDTALAELSQKCIQTSSILGVIILINARYSELPIMAASSSLTTRTHRLHPFYLSQYQTLMQKQKYASSLARKPLQLQNRPRPPLVGSKKWRDAAPTTQIQRSQLTQPQPSWSMLKQHEGLPSRPLTEEVQQKVADWNSPAAGDKWWTVEYSKRYKGVTKTFMQAVMTGGSV